VRHVRMLGLCLVAALALGAYAVSSASALEWGKCEFVGSGGQYGGSGATEGTGQNCAKSEKAKPKGTGEYEWRKASEVAEQRGEGTVLHVPFTGAGGEGVLTSTLRFCEAGPGAVRTTRQGCAELGGEEESYETEVPGVICEAEHAVGTTSGKNKVEGIEVAFEGCEYLSGALCTSTGAAEGEIKTSELKGKLAWISKSPKVVGVVLEPAGKKHPSFAHFVCGGVVEFTVGVGNKNEGTWYVNGENYPAGCGGECPGATPIEEKHGGYDQVISPITPINKMTEEFTQVYAGAGEAPFGNLPHELYKKHISALEDHTGYVANPGYEFDWAAASEEITNVNTPEEAGEIKA
jgi:hypothetical protein